MNRWTNLERSRTRNKRTVGARKKLLRPEGEPLEGRIAPAAALAAPRLVDPAAVVRVDQNTYTIRGILPAPARTNIAVRAYRDDNLNGLYDPRVDRLVGAAVVPKNARSFAVRVNLVQNFGNRFFVVANQGARRSAP